jgi:4'-phosphopantetheinyl transferase
MNTDCERSYELSDRAVHVWTMHTAACAALAAKFEPVLAQEEKERAARFRFDRLRHSFYITRGTLRHLLGRYLDSDPSSLRLETGAKGKPVLAGGARVEFNMTHSGAWASFAFTIGCPIGIDLEVIRPVSEAHAIAALFFCPEETAEILSLPPSECDSGFFRCWTRKEAYVKAIGNGLLTPLNEFRVALRLNDPPRFIHLAADLSAAKMWHLHDLSSGDYAAAIAYPGGQRSLTVISDVHPADLTNTNLLARFALR